MKSFILIEKLKLIALCILLFSGSYLTAQTDPDFEWVKNIGGSGYESIEDIASDASGNVYVIGSFENTIQIGSTSLVSSGSYDIFFAKFDQNGNPLFAISAGGPEYDIGHSISIDNNGDILVAGIFSGTASFGGSNLVSRGVYDIFIGKYSSTGALLWIDRAGGQGYDFVSEITSDNQNNIFITGTFEFSAIFDTISVSGGELTSIYLAKYNSQGKAQWVRTGTNSFYSVGSYGVATSSTNDVYITGSFESSIEFSGAVLTGQNGSDMFVNKYNSNGTLIWAIPVTGMSYYERGRDVFVGEDDMVYVTGSFGETVQFGNFTLNSSSISDIFVVKYTPEGDPVWVTQDAIHQYHHEGYGVAVDRAGNVSVISQIPQEFLSAEVNNVYLSRYNKNGQKIWGLICGGEDNDSPGKISIDINGDIIACGTFYESGTFGSHILNGNGYYDGFFGKIPAPHFSVTNNTIDFGNVAVGGTRNLNLIIHNTAKTTLHFYNTLISGNDASVFSLSQPPVSIEPLDSVTLSLGFSPLTSGIKSAHILFESDSPFSPDTVFLTGSAGSVTIMLSTSLLDFGSVDTSGTAVRTVTVTNVGSSPATILLPLILGLNQGDFSVNNVQTFPDTLQPQQTKNINITFSPGALGIRSAQLQVLSNAASSPDLVSLQGTGTAAAAIISLSTSLLDFGTVDINNFSERILTITNTGSLQTVIDAASILPTGNTDFSIVTPNFPVTLLPEAVANVTIRFTPTTVGGKLAQLRIISNAISSPDLVELEGNAVMGIVVNLPPSPQLGQTINLIVSPPQGFTATGGQIFFRQAGEQLYSNSALTLQDTSYITSISPQFSTIKGIEFYIEFTDGESLVTYPTSNAASQPAVLQINVPVFPFQGVIPNAEYRMVSIPLSINNPDILSVFGDDYGQYDSTLWRVFRWNSIQNNYDEFPNIASGLTPGNAFWLVHRQGTSFDIDNAVSVQTSNDFIINLPANSWTQLGNPFAFSVDWTMIEGSSLVNLPIRWDPDTADYVLNQTILEPWDGYWVRNPLNQVVTLNIPPIRSAIEKQIPKYVTFGSGEFVVQVKTRVEGSRYIDNQNYVGMINDKKNIYAANLPEPPPITNDIRLSIVEDNKYLAQKTLSVNTEGSSWDLQLSTSHRNKNIQVNFDCLNTLPDGFKIYLLDVDRQIAIPIHNNLAVIKIADGDRINLKLIIGTQNFAENNSENISLTPTEYVLDQNYPNPFNPSTNISYYLKEKSTVTLEVYDILGNRITTLIDSKQQNSGSHSVVWNGVNTNGVSVSSGVYIYKLRANEFAASRKMILLK